MTIRNLDKMFRPASVVLVGASARPGSIGRVLLANFLSSNYKGKFAVIHPGAPEISGFATVGDVASLDFVPDLAIIATPPQTVPALVRDLARIGTKAAVIITAGFSELGADGRALQAEMLQAAQPSLMRLIGPNCLGIIVPGIGLNASFSHINPQHGHVALVSQSGAIVTATLDWAAARGIGFSQVVSLGSKADVDFGDMLDYLALDAGTHSILLYIEAIEHARKFMSAARRAARLKPVIVIKAGRHIEAAKAAASHTGALAGSDAVYHAAFRRAGMLRVNTIEDLFVAAEALAAKPARQEMGEALAILTNGGGFGVLATDRLIDKGGKLADLSAETIEALDKVLPTTWSHANPIDIIGDADPSRYQAALEIVLEDPGTSAVLVINCPTATIDGTEAAKSVAAVIEKSNKPVFTSWLGDISAVKPRQVFYEHSIATYDTPDLAIDAFTLQLRYQKNQRLLLEAPAEKAVMSTYDKISARNIINASLASNREWLNEEEGKRLLACYSIPVVETRAVADIEAAVAAASQMGFPCAIKILSPDITHKTDVGGVALNLEDATALRKAAEEMLASVHNTAPQARLQGFTVQKMASRPGAVELIAGIMEDPTFGPVILFGQGGVTVEIVKDRAIALPPLNAALAADLVSRTNVSKLLASYRGHPAANMAAIQQVIMALGELAADFPEIVELDINPLWADQKGVMALDARVRVRASSSRGSERFAIRPYPAPLACSLSDRSGRQYTARPIKPTDVVLIDQFLAKTDKEDLRMRFLSPLRSLPRELAISLTQIDYDRDMAFVVFTDESQNEVAAVGRLSEDPDRERAEYAILVRTDHHGRGLGYALMQKLLEYARSRGIGEIFGHVLRENRVMLDMCKELGFQRRFESEPGVIEVFLPLGKSSA